MTIPPADLIRIREFFGGKNGVTAGKTVTPQGTAADDTGACLLRVPRSWEAIELLGEFVCLVSFVW